MKKPAFGASSFIWASPFSTETLDLLDRAKNFGFDIFEICIEDPATIDVDRINERLVSSGMTAMVCGAFGPTRDVSSTDPGTRANGVAYIKTCVDIAQALNAPMVSGPMYAATGKTALLSPDEKEQQWQFAADNLREVADYASEKGIKLAIEPLNRFETDLLNTVEQAMELLSRIDRDNVGLLLDTFHLNIEEHSIPDALRRAGDRIFNFHSCANDRGTPGNDHLPWTEIRDALEDVGYTGPWIIETFDPSIKEIARAVSIWRPLADSQDAIARDGVAFLKTLFER